MKTNAFALVLALALTFVLQQEILAQNITLVPKKTIYTRKLTDIRDDEKTFEVRYPVVRGSMPAAARRKLENTISYWRVFETSLKEGMEATWLRGLDYTVNYNKNGILDLTLTQEGMGAYPSTSNVNLVVDLRTGEQIKFGDVFRKDSQGVFAGLVNRKLQAEKSEILRERKKMVATGDETKESVASASESLRTLRFTAASFKEFSVSDRGVTILYDAGFPHVILALQPEGRYFFNWVQVKPFIRRDGLLAKFVR